MTLDDLDPHCRAAADEFLALHGAENTGFALTHGTNHGFVLKWGEDAQLQFACFLKSNLAECNGRRFILRWNDGLQVKASRDWSVTLTKSEDFSEWVNRAYGGQS